MDFLQTKAALLELCLSNAMVVAPSGQLLAANAAAQELLSTHQALVVIDGLISTRRADEAEALVDALTHTRQAATPQLMVLRSRSGVPILVLALSPSPDGLNVLVIATDLGAPFKLGIEPLRALFGFTPAEARTAIGLVNGASATALADAYGVSITTIRSHLRALLRKTGALSQSGLIAVLLRAEHARTVQMPVP